MCSEMKEFLLPLIFENFEKRLAKLEKNSQQGPKSDEQIEELKLRANLFEGAVHNLKASLQVSNQIISNALMRNDFVSLRNGLVEVQKEIVKAMSH